MRLILTRHGETIENKNGMLPGHLPGILSEEGKNQAKKLALRLKNEKIDEIYSSDLQRAKDTTNEILKFHKNILVHYTKELRERNVGSYTGKYKKDIDMDNFPKDAETLEEMKNRAKKFLDSVYDNNKTILFVCHSHLMRAFISVLFSSNIEEVEKPKNTAVTIIELKEDKNHKIILLNCIKHLN
ncbi:histidine phosphatase family protein [Candidatus Woesearchaeota archaeon]|nr:histidine phosphatase family protein [Candidatus Woesearchaeota archaeon]